MKLTPWRKGPPPMVGWWNASVLRDPNCRRWWNGYRWSVPVRVGIDSAAVTRHLKCLPFDETGLFPMEWRGLATPPKGRA